MSVFKPNLTAYSALAGSFLLGSKQAEGQVIFHDLDPDILIEVASSDPGFETLEIDINFDGIGDFSAAIRSTGFCSGCQNMSSAYFRGLGENEVAGRSIRYSIECSTYSTFIMSDTIKIVQNIGIGHSIPDTMTFNSEPAFIFQQDGGYGYCHLNLVGEEDRESIFLPIKLKLGDNSHFGWIRFRSEQLVEDSQIMTRIYLEEYAYNSTPDAAIITSEIPLEINTEFTTSLQPKIYLEGNQLNILSPISTNGETSISIYNISGMEVFQDKNQYRYQVALQEGIYIIDLRWKNQWWSGKTIITF